MSSDDALILCALEECGPLTGTRRLAQVTEIPQRRLFMSLQRLEHKKLIEEKKRIDETGEKNACQRGGEKGKGEEQSFRIFPPARGDEKVCQDFRHLNEDLEKICFAGFTEEEKGQYGGAAAKIR